MDCHDSIAKKDVSLRISSDHSKTEDKIKIKINVANNTASEICLMDMDYIDSYVWPYEPFSGWAVQVLYSDSLYMFWFDPIIYQLQDYEIQYSCIESSSGLSGSMEVNLWELISLPSNKHEDKNTLYGTYSIQLFYRDDIHKSKNAYRGCLVSNVIDIDYLEK